jgi:adenylate cyclase
VRREGTVRRDGKAVRLTIRLVDAQTDKTLWSESYDRDLTDIFAIQSDIAQTVCSKFKRTIVDKAAERDRRETY